MKIFAGTTEKEDVEANNLEKTMKETGNNCTQSDKPAAIGTVPESYKPIKQQTLGETIMSVINIICHIMGAVGIIYIWVICFIISFLGINTMKATGLKFES